MAHLKVQTSAQTKASVDQAWEVVKDFCTAWHPAVETMFSVPSPNGALVRQFTVKNEDTIYREKLTYFCSCEKTMAYTHVAGISGVERYEARLKVSASAQGTLITMSAEITAPIPRAHDIASGTKAIFDIGVACIAEQALHAIPTSFDKPAANDARLFNMEIDTLPKLAVTSTHQEGDILTLFLHGIGGNRSNWADQLKAVAPMCTAAAMDLRGYGGSTLGPEQSTVDAYCDDIIRMMDVFGASRIVLCGLSYGAWISTSFAMRHPDKLAALVLSGGCTGMSEAGPDERDAFRLSREVPMSAGQTPADFAPSVVNVISGPKATDAMQATLRRSMEEIPSDTYADALRCFTNPLEKFDFSKLTMPVLLMTGEHDRLAPPDEIKRVAERIWDESATPDVRYEVIPGAGHVCNIEKPALYNALLTEFLSRVLP